MKQLFILSAFLVSASGFFLSSCKKDTPTQQAKSSFDSPQPSTKSSSTYYFVANNWKANVNGIFINLLVHVLPGDITSNVNQVKIFLITSGGELQINNHIFFMGGELWAEAKYTDLIISFRYSGNKLPFTYLDIKVVVG